MLGMNVLIPVSVKLAESNILDEMISLLQVASLDVREYVTFSDSLLCALGECPNGVGGASIFAAYSTTSSSTSI
jgi:hypothetical protein